MLLSVALLLMGCATTKEPRPSRASALAPALSPNLASPYLLSSPHSRLYVEVDAVEGCEPTETALVQLHEFLSKRCQKPDGVKIMVSDIIPRKAARKTGPRALARRYLNGPPDDNASPPAFMYVLYYPGWPGFVPPFAEVTPYPGIYFNARFSLGIASDEILLHEAGHLLGLVNRTEQIANGHCSISGCQMNNHWGYLRQFRWLPGRKQSPLCADCLNELAQAVKQSRPSTLRYVGPVLVHPRSDYDVLTLPHRCMLKPGGATDSDCRQFAADVHAKAVTANDDWFRIDCRANAEFFDNPLLVTRMMIDCLADPLPAIRKFGPGVLLRTALNRYEPRREFSNAIVVLEQAIQLDPANAQNYRLLAWIKATSPDASVRNGTEAAQAAHQACELTKWQHWDTIDTLAAAYAETGDFKRATELQHQALRTGKPSPSDQTAMRERLALYQQAQPFRASPGSD